MSELSKQLRRYTEALDTGDFETVVQVLAIAEWDHELSQTIWHWHGEHDEIVELTEEDRARIRKIVDDVLKQYE